MRILPLALIFASIPLPAFPQEVTILLQRAIFLEETVGNPVGAIKLYRQILSSGGGGHAYEAEAQYRLGQCLLKQGDKQLAAAAFQDLMRNHPEETRLLAMASLHYVDAESGFSFTVPDGWAIHPRPPYNEPGGSCADLEDPAKKATIVICAKTEGSLPEGIRNRLLQGEAERVQKRRMSWPDFTLRPGSPTPGQLGGQPALTIIADYTIGKERMTEWTMWIQNETTRSSVSVHSRKADFPEFQTRFAPILSSYRIP